jgi:NADPH-dependent F420 reductase
MADKLPVLAVLGGTGNLGLGLAGRWALAGYEVVIGSRAADKAIAAADELRKLCASRGRADARVSGKDNRAAAEASQIVALTVPFENQKAVLEVVKPVVQGKVFIDATVPLVPPRVARVQLPAEGSAGRIAQNLLGEGVKVVSAFQNVAADLLQSGDALDCDVLVCGDSKEAREQVVSLVQAAGMRGFHAGSLDNGAAADALTSVLIFVNKQYGCHAGIRLTGVPEGKS